MIIQGCSSWTSMLRIGDKCKAVKFLQPILNWEANRALFKEMNWHFSALIYTDPVSFTRQVTLAASLLTAVTLLPCTVWGGFWHEPALCKLNPHSCKMAPHLVECFGITILKFLILSEPQTLSFHFFVLIPVNYRANPSLSYMCRMYRNK